MLRTTLRPIAIALICVAAIPAVRAHEHPSSIDSVVQLPGNVMTGEVTFMTGIGPAPDLELVHVTWDLTFVANASMAAADVSLYVKVPVDGGSKEWLVTGSDLGWGTTPGTYQATIGTDALNGLVWGSPFLPGASIIDVHIEKKGGGGIHGQFVNSKLVMEANGTLTGSTATISLALGGAQDLGLDAGPAFAGRTYVLLGSVSGTAPGIPTSGGVLPLNYDGYLLFTAANPNTALLPGSAGSLDAAGQATAKFQLPPTALPGLVGLTLNHAFVALDATGTAPEFVSIPVDVELTP